MVADSLVGVLAQATRPPWFQVVAGIASQTFAVRHDHRTRQVPVAFRGEDVVVPPVPIWRLHQAVVGRREQRKAVHHLVQVRGLHLPDLAAAAAAAAAAPDAAAAANPDVAAAAPAATTVGRKVSDRRPELQPHAPELVPQAPVERGRRGVEGADGTSPGPFFAQHGAHYRRSQALAAVLGQDCYTCDPSARNPMAAEPLVVVNAPGGGDGTFSVEGTQPAVELLYVFSVPAEIEREVEQ